MGQNSRPNYKDISSELILINNNRQQNHKPLPAFDQEINAAKHLSPPDKGC